MVPRSIPTAFLFAMMCYSQLVLYKSVLLFWVKIVYWMVYGPPTTYKGARQAYLRENSRFLENCPYWLSLFLIGWDLLEHTWLVCTSGSSCFLIIYLDQSKTMYGPELSFDLMTCQFSSLFLINTGMLGKIYVLLYCLTVKILMRTYLNSFYKI